MKSIQSLIAALALCLLAVSLPAQEFKTREQKNRELLWGQPSKEFKVLTAPEKWKDQSAVILAFERTYRLYDVKPMSDKVNHYYDQDFTLHVRIKLQDKVAVKSYSELSFSKGNKGKSVWLRGHRSLGIKIVKPDGKEEILDLKKAVAADASSGQDVKIPVPNLEPGDILDYYMAIHDQTTAILSPNDEELMAGDYPILFQKLVIRCPKRYFVYSKPMYGAPDFVEKEDGSEHVYTLEDRMREKMPELMWYYPYRYQPQVRYCVAGKKTGFDPKKNLEMSTPLVFMHQGGFDVGVVKDYMDAHFPDEKDARKIVEECFYLFRHPIYQKGLLGAELMVPLAEADVSYLFYLLMRSYLKGRKIESNLLAVAKRRYGPVAETVNLGTCDFVLRVNTDPPMYLGLPEPFALPGEIPYKLENGEAVAIPSQAKLDTLPSSPYPDNASETTYLLKMQQDASLVAVERTVTLKGYNKLASQYDVVTDYDYYKATDLPQFQLQKSHMVRSVLKQYNAEMQRLEQNKNAQYATRDKTLKSEIESDMSLKVKEYSDFKLLNMGIWKKDPDLRYSDKFVLEDLLRQAGPNLILDLGKLIGEQVQIKPEDEQRSADIDMDFARSYHNEIVLEIPGGYTVEGLESFRVQVENKNGGFVSTAVQEGNRVKIRTHKYYTSNHFSVSQWPQIISFVNAAYNFASAKLLLKKM